MKKVVYLVAIIGFLIMISGCTATLKSADKEKGNSLSSPENNISIVQAKLDAYLVKYPELRDNSASSADCYLTDAGTSIVLSCPFGTIERFNQTDDKVSFYHQSSGGSVGAWTTFIPHFEPINKSQDFKLVREGPDYLFDCNPNPFQSTEEIRVPYKILVAKDAEKYTKASKERCAGYTTDYIKSACMQCLINKMDSLVPSPDISYCSDFKEYSNLYGVCLGNVASISSNVKVCLESSDTTTRDNCYYTYARGQRDVSLCANIIDATTKDNCNILIPEIIADVGQRK